MKKTPHTEELPQEIIHAVLDQVEDAGYMFHDDIARKNIKKILARVEATAHAVGRAERDKEIVEHISDELYFSTKANKKHWVKRILKEISSSDAHIKEEI